MLQKAHQDQEAKSSDSFPKYLPIRISGKKVFALLDSGNSWHSCISLRLLHSIGLTENDLIPAPDKSIGTANTRDTLRCLGQLPQPIRMSLTTPKGQRIGVDIQPYVVSQLATDFNISGPFMHMEG